MPITEEHIINVIEEDSSLTDILLSESQRKIEDSKKEEEVGKKEEEEVGKKEEEEVGKKEEEEVEGKEEKKEEIGMEGEEEKENDWLKKENQYLIRSWHQELTYINIVLQFFGEKMKEKESQLGWWIIVISSIVSFLTLLDLEKLGLSTDFNKYYGWIKTIVLSILSITTTLIAAWMKKKNYIKRIKDTDKRIYDIEILTGLIYYEFRKPLREKVKFIEFTNKYFGQVNTYKSYTSLISPSEWKETIYKITKEHPNYVRYQFPWWRDVTKRVIVNGKPEVKSSKRPDINWGKNIIRNYETTDYKSCLSKIFSCYFCCSKCCRRIGKNNDGNPFTSDVDCTNPECDKCKKST